jgi:hypothetical protein
MDGKFEEPKTNQHMILISNVIVLYILVSQTHLATCSKTMVYKPLETTQNVSDRPMPPPPPSTYTNFIQIHTQ